MRLSHQVAAVVVTASSVLAVTMAARDSAFAQHPLPPADAPVAQVAASYWHAAVSGDCEATRALTSGDAWAWCDVPRVTAIERVDTTDLISEQRTVPGETAGAPSRAGSRRGAPVSLTTYQSERAPAQSTSTSSDRRCLRAMISTTGSPDRSVVEGQHLWTLCLEKTPAGWRVYEQGPG